MTLRIVHTSDWHLGHSLASHSRAYEHDRFLRWLLDQLEDHEADVLLIAGDVFDKVIPPASAQRQFYEFLCDARDRRPDLDVVVIAGNHDGAHRLAAAARLARAQDIHIVGQHDGSSPNDVVIPVRDADGDVAAHVVAMPFLRAGSFPAALTTAEGHAELYRRALDQARQRSSGQAVLAMGHCHVAGGQVTDSERPVLRGGEEAVSAGMFDADVAYVALGHLHLAQEVGDPRIRYCGSPIPLSMAETSYPHQVLLLEVEGDALRSVRPLHVPRTVPLRRFRGPLDQVLEEIRRCGEHGELPEVGAPLETHAFVDVRLTEPHPRVREHVREALEAFGARLVSVRIEAPARAPDDTTWMPAAGNGLETCTPEVVFEALHRKERGAAPSEALVHCFGELVSLIGTEAESGTTP